VVRGHVRRTARGFESSHREVLREFDKADYTGGKWPITTRVPCDYFEVRRRALFAHATQIDSGCPMFSCPDDVELPEDDLVAGVRVDEPGVLAE